MSLNQSFFLISQNIHADLKGPKIKYKLHYGRCTGRRFTAATMHNTAAVKANKNQNWAPLRAMKTFIRKKLGHTT